MPLAAYEFNLYEALEVTQDATEQEIIASYRRLARIHHPDKNPDDANATARFQRIQTAHETLKDAALRRRYDAHLKRPTQANRSQAQHHHNHYSEYEDGDEEEDGYYYGNESDEEEAFFNDFFRNFDGASGRFGGGGGRFGDGFGFAGHDGPRETFEEMNRRFAEQEARDDEFRAAQAKERRERLEHEEREREKKRAEKKWKEDAEKEALEKREKAAKLKQEERWNAAGVTTKTEKQSTCHHDAFWQKFQQKRKFKCEECGQKRSMVSFQCPHCNLLVCQLCNTQLRQRHVIE